MVRRKPLHPALLIAAALLAGPAAGYAQGLAGAAKKAEVQRKESTVPPKVIQPPQPPIDTGPVRLTVDLLSRYSEARLALAALRRGDRRLDTRVQKAWQQVKHYDDMPPVLEQEPDIVDLLANFRLAPATYLQIERAMYLGRDYARYKSLSRDRLTPRDRENAAFVAEHLYIVEGIFERSHQAEQGLRLWSPIPAYL